MPEHLRALVVILVLAAIVFRAAQGPACAQAIDPADFRRRRNLWFAITLIAFLSGSFWIYILLSALVLLITVPAEQNRVALFFALLFAVPPVAAKVSGLGLMEHAFAVNHVRLLAFTVLLPAFVYLVTRADRLRFGSVWPDRLLLGYLAVNFGVMLYVTTFTNVLRHGLFYAFIDVVLPYYVASRGLRDLKAFRDVVMTFVVAAMVLSLVGIFEMTRHWMLYSALIGALEVPWGYGRYLPRGDFALRAQATTGQPIALGFVIMTALALLLYARTLVPSPLMRRLGFALLAGGLFAALSRGPWIGAAAAIVVFVGTGGSAIRSLARYAAVGIVAVPLVLLLPGVQSLVELLPFVGSTESANVEYRRRLLDTAAEAIWQSPLFGGIDIYSTEGNEGLRQHYGTFIDVVNTYVEIMLVSGLVGLAFFLAFFASVGLALLRQLRALTDPADERSVLGRALLAALAGIAVTIFTVSSITTIPVVYWSVAGMAVGWLGLAQAPARAGDPAAAAPVRAPVVRPVPLGLRR
jgi:O-antigen ligase